MWATEVMQEHGCSFIHQSTIGRAVGGFIGRVAGRETGRVLQQFGGPGSSTTTAISTRPITSGRVTFGGPAGSAPDAFNPVITGGFTGVTRAGGPSIIDTAINRFAPTNRGGAAALPSCGTGFHRDAQGRCVKSGVIGALQRFVPGGKTGLQPMLEDFGEAVMGRFGAALVPAQLPATRLRCPRGAVLGMDDLCYNRRDLKKSERKWPPGTRPVLTGGQVNTLREAQRIQHRMAKLGLTGTPTHHRRKTRKLLR